MNPLSPSSAAGTAAPTEAYANRVVHAARQFEAVLLNTLLGSLEHSFSALPGRKRTPLRIITIPWACRRWLPRWPSGAEWA